MGGFLSGALGALAGGMKDRKKKKGKSGEDKPESALNNIGKQLKKTFGRKRQSKDTGES